MKLLGNRVQLTPIIREVTAGGIHLARMSRQMPNEGVITAISYEAAKISGCKVGDKVFFDKHKQKIDEHEHTTMLKGEKGEELILAIVT